MGGRGAESECDTGLGGWGWGGGGRCVVVVEQHPAFKLSQRGGERAPLRRQLLQQQWTPRRALPPPQVPQPCRCCQTQRWERPLLAMLSYHLDNKDRGRNGRNGSSEHKRPEQS